MKLPTGLTTLELENVGATLVVRLHRPHRMNAVIEKMYDELQHVLDLAAADATVRCLVLTGCPVERLDGTIRQAFCAGADLKEHAAGVRTPAQKREYILQAHRSTQALYEFPKPVIAAVNGAARGAGAEMALNCDFVLMAEAATLAFTETGLGTFVGGGVTRHLSQLVGMAKAKWLIYSGSVVDGPAAQALGLAWRTLPLDELLPAALEMAEQFAARAPISIALARRLMQEAPQQDLSAVLHAETEAILACMETEDWSEGIRSFAEKRAPHFKGR